MAKHFTIMILLSFFPLQANALSKCEVSANGPLKGLEKIPGKRKTFYDTSNPVMAESGLRAILIQADCAGALAVVSEGTADNLACRDQQVRKTADGVQVQRSCFDRNLVKVEVKYSLSTTSAGTALSGW